MSEDGNDIKLPTRLPTGNIRKRQHWSKFSSGLPEGVLTMSRFLIIFSKDLNRRLGNPSGNFAVAPHVHMTTTNPTH